MRNEGLSPLRGDLWMADLNPTMGREQAGIRPVLIVSVDSFNDSPAEMVVIVPLTSKNKNVSLHVPITPPEGGLSVASWIKCDDVRAISKERMISYRGRVSPDTVAAVEANLRRLLGL